ncbi:MAG TPA: amino acid adenylation domain-containing protein, partial [Pyrinomonadaceae bacterium]|nr:amino acid adenylation domain-containing protein [Pyrinomonadaceae bacterium]
RLGAVPATVQTVNLAGEPLARRLVDQLYGLETVAKVYNLYGPSETTTYSTWSLVGRGREAPTIGRPISNTQVYVLNEGLEPVPLRGIGELYIGGAGVARGYLQRPGLTAERFVPDPFSGVAGARLYRTGDLARYRSDSELEFLGRADNQLKLRGYRIELGEIEATLEAEPQVKQAAVVVHESQYGPQLVAYVTGESNRNPDTRQLRVHLKLRLPEYMVPAAFVVLEEMPLNPNGKIDRRTLRTLKPELSQSANAEPLTATEEWIASLWTNVLNVEPVGPEDNFFDLGGHSLLATRLLARVRETSGVELNLRQLFEEPTVRQMAQQIESELRVGTAVPESAIERLPRKGGEPTRLSFAQQRLWFLEQLEQAGPAYNMAFAWRLKGTLNLEVLEAALTEITRRHEVFRSTFKLVNERPAQITQAAERFRVTTIDLQESDDATARAQQEAERPFDLQRGPLLRATVLRLANDAVLLVAMHHICFDGWSIGVLSKELSTLYSAYLNNEAPDLPELQIQYADFAQWQRDWFKGPVLSEQVSYWKERLSGAPEFLELPTDRPRPRTESFNGAWYCSSLPQELVRRVHDFSRRESASLFMTLLATFQMLLSRYTHQDDIVIGTPIANRTRTETEDLIGFFVNTLLVRTDLSGGPTFRELLKQVRDRALEAYAHQDLPFEKLVEELQPSRSLSYTPLFQVLFVLQNVPLPQLKLPGLEAEEFEFERKTSKFDLSLYVVEKSGTLNCYFEYNTDLFDAATIERMAVHFRTLLRAIIADPDRSIVTLPLLDEEQQQQIAEWNATTADFPTVCVTQLFEEQARKSPDTIALECASTALTYDDLNSAANRLARYLQKREVGTETLVGIFMDRSPEMVVAIIAVLKAGAAYLPLDTGYPRERLSLMLEDAEPLIVLTQENLVQQLPQCNAKILAVDRDRDLLAWESSSNPSIPLSTANLAYVIYTSGSTGKPKGVQISHRALMNFLSSMQKCPGLNADDVMLSVTTLSFDIAGLEIYLPLITGARVVLVTQEVATDGRLLIEALHSSRATVMQATPSTWRLLLEAGWQDDRELKLLCGGEALRRDLSEQLLQRGASLWNLYGPTETTIWSTLCRVERGDPFVHVGRPIANTQVFILDEQMQLVPPLVSAELYIGGEGLARGYLKRPELTATQFVPNPFSRNAGERLYKTGDRARYLSDGNVEILGRTDHQVKLRGYRIELGEIEEALSQHPLVSRSVAIATEPTPGDHRLIAYFVSDSPAQLAGKTELISGQVSQWETMWNETYSRPSADDSHEATLNLKGWISSYTGQPVPVEQMREWVDNTVERILSLAPKRVLDIGCGTGLLLFRVAPQCSEYTGVDLSESALEYVGQQLQQPAMKLPQVILQKCAADEVVTVIKEPVDTVILNSVVQYFPSVDYLIAILSQIAKKVRPGGAIFIGDVRSLPLLEAFHASVQLHQCPDSLSRRELAQRVRRHMDQEEELIIDPALFTSLTDKLPQISSVEVQAKRSRFQNELTRFRYDVILHVGDRIETSNGDRPAVVDWGLEGFSTTRLRQFLKDYRPDDLFLTNVPNARVVADVVARTLIADPSGPATAGEIRAALDKVRRDEAVDPEELWKLGEELGYRVEVGYAGLDTSGSFRVRLAHVENTSMPALPVSTNRAHKVKHSLANDPLRGKLYNALVPELKNHLRARLPEHMMPDTFVMLDELPLTPNGKVDRRALPEPLSAFTHGRKYTPEHLTEREFVLKSIWENLLNLAPIRLEDNFFELGGHSLLATRLLARVRDAFGVELTLRQLFEGPKLRQMAAQVEALAAQSSARDRIERKAREEGKPFELSYAQQRLWFIEQLTQGSPFYNVGGVVRLKGELDVSALERSFDEIVRRHEVLRTTFQNSAGRPVAVVSPPGRMRLIAHDLSARDFEQDAEAQNFMQAEANHVFDLAVGPLIRLTLIKLRATEHLLLLNMHHIISDAWSLSIFMRELSALYRAFTKNQPSPLPELPIQYGDYASWQLSNGERFDEELSYWKQQLAGAPAVLQLPTEQGRPAVVTHRGGRVEVRLPAELTRGLKQLSSEHSATLFMTLLAGFAAVLGRYTNEREVLLGTPVAGRQRVETEPLIGFFVNTLVVRVDLSGGPTFAELLARVREIWLGAYEHQAVPFERLVEALQVERSLSHTPLFQVLFGLNNVGRERLELGAVQGELEEVDGGTTKFDLTLLVAEAGEEIRGVLSYRLDLFEA